MPRRSESPNLTYTGTTQFGAIPMRLHLFLISTFIAGSMFANAIASAEEQPSAVSSVAVAPSLWQAYHSAGMKALSSGNNSEAEHLLISALKQFPNFDTQNSFCRENLTDLLNLFRSQNRLPMESYIQGVLDGKQQFSFEDFDLNWHLQTAEGEADAATETSRAISSYTHLLATEPKLAARERISSKLARALLKNGDLERSEEVLLNALGAYDRSDADVKKVPAAQAGLVKCLSSLADALFAQKKPVLGRALLSEAVNRQVALFGPNHPDSIEMIYRLQAVGSKIVEPEAAVSKPSQPNTQRFSTGPEIAGEMSNRSQVTKFPNLMIASLIEATQPKDITSSSTSAPKPIPPKTWTASVSPQPVGRDKQPGAAVEVDASAPPLRQPATDQKRYTYLVRVRPAVVKYRLIIIGALTADKVRALSDAELTRVERYVSKMQVRLKAEMDRAPLEGTGTGAVVFVVNTKGAITGSRTLAPSSNLGLGNSVLAAVLKSQPFGTLSNVLFDGVGFKLEYEL